MVSEAPRGWNTVMVLPARASLVLACSPSLCTYNPDNLPNVLLWLYFSAFLQNLMKSQGLGILYEPSIFFKFIKKAQNPPHEQKPICRAAGHFLAQKRVTQKAVSFKVHAAASKIIRVIGLGKSPESPVQEQVHRYLISSNRRGVSGLFSKTNCRPADAASNLVALAAFSEFPIRTC